MTKSEPTPELSKFSKAFNDFIDNQQLCIDKHELILRTELRHNVNANFKHPFFVSRLRLRDLDKVDDEGLSEDLLLQFYTARIVELHKIYGLKGSLLKAEVQRHFVKHFPECADLLNLSDDNVTQSNAQTDGSEERVTNNSSTREDEEKQDFNEHIVVQRAVHGMGYFLNRRVEECFRFLRFYLELLGRAIHWVWTSPVLFLPRSIVGSFFWIGLSLMVCTFLSTLLWSIFKGRILEITAGITVPFIGRLSQFQSNDLHYPHESPPEITQSLSTMIQNYTNITTPIFPTLNNIGKIHNFSLEMYAVHDILSETSEDIRAASLIVTYSDILHREKLVPAYGILEDQTVRLGQNLHSYQSNVEKTFANIKMTLRWNLREFTAMSFDFGHAVPLPPDPVVHSLQRVFKSLVAGCRSQPFEWMFQSCIFCLTAFSLNSFLEQEIECMKSTDYELQDCLFLSSSSRREALIKRRQDIFEKVLGKYVLIFDDLAIGLQTISNSLGPPQKLLEEIKEVSQSIDQYLYKSQDALDTKYNQAAALQQQRDREWESRNLAQRIHDWYANKHPDKGDFMQIAKIYTKARDLAALNSFHEKISRNLQSTRGLVESSQEDVFRARIRAGIVKKYFLTTFCIGKSNSDRQDCGTDLDFAVGIRAIINEMYELEPFLEQVEHAGVMTNAIRDALRQKRENIEKVCAEEEAVFREKFENDNEENPFLFREKLEDHKRACRLKGYAES